MGGIDTVTDTAMELSDFLPFTKDQIQATPLKRHTRTTCVCLLSASTLAVFYSPSLELDTQIAQALMYAQLLLTEPSRKRVVYRSPVDTLI